MDKHEIRRVENTPTACAYAVSDRWSQNGVFNRECLECNAADLRRRALFDQMSILDGAAF